MEEKIPTWNVAGLVEGTDPVLGEQYVVFTAHLDGTAPREEGEINNSADDNASGSAGLIEIAKAVATTPPRRSVVFVICSGEEAACIGSRHFMSDCPVPLDLRNRHGTGEQGEALGVERTLSGKTGN